MASALVAGERLSAPARRMVGPSPAGFEAVVFDGAPRESVSGWFVRGKPGAGAVLLLHGVRGDRRNMADRAKFLRAAGYSVLLIDLQAHGESGGKRITFGHHEAEGVKAAMRFLAQRLPEERTAVIGVSLGAASFVLASESVTTNAVVLESMYPTIEEAIADRLSMRIGAFGKKLTPVLLWQLPLWLGIDASQLRPIDHIGQLHAPVLIAAGTRDEHTTLAETRRLHAAAADPKELWLIDGAAHVDLHAFNPTVYEQTISAFLSKYLRP